VELIREDAGRDRMLAVAACAIVFVGTVEPANFEEVGVVQVLVAGSALVVLGLVLAGKAGPRVVVALVGVVGLTLRLTASAPLSSDVVKATAEAIATLQGGGDPYTRYYLTTNPPGSPFVYLPGELALYEVQNLVLGGLQSLDRWWGILTLGAMLSLAPVCGWGMTAFAAAFYAVDSIAVWRSLDGSNDTGLAFLITVAVATLAYGVAFASRRENAAARLHVASAVFLGWGLAFKALSWPLAPFIVLFVAPKRRLQYGAIAAGVLVLFCLPFAALAPLPFFTALTRLDTLHANIWGFNLWSSLLYQHLAVPAQFDWALRLRYAIPLLALIALWRRAATLGLALLQGALVVGAALLVAPWSTSSYYVYLVILVLTAIAASTLPAES
jgi:hypothetical protein